jgi:hypothetical protein
MKRNKVEQCPCGAKLANIYHDEAYYVASRDFWSWKTLLAAIAEESRKPTGPDKARLTELIQALDNWLQIHPYRKIYQCPHCGRLSVSNMDPEAVFNLERREFQFAPESGEIVTDLFKPVDLETILNTPPFRGQVSSHKYQEPIGDAEDAADAMVYFAFGAGGRDTKTRLKDALAAVQKCGDGWHSLEAITGYLKVVIHNNDLVRRLDAWVEEGELEKRDFSMFARTEYRLKPK